MTEPASPMKVRLEGVEAELMMLTEKVHSLSGDVYALQELADDLDKTLGEAAIRFPVTNGPSTADQPDSQTASDDNAATTPSEEPASAIPASPEPASTADPATDSGTTAATPNEAQLFGWVDAQIASLVRKFTTSGEGIGIRWCRQWWRHDEARTRFTALYLAYDHLAGTADEDGTWLSTYLRDHLDHHLMTLTSPVGPFSSCSPTRHSPVITPLGHDPLDAGQPDQGALAVALNAQDSSEHEVARDSDQADGSDRG